MKMLLKYGIFIVTLFGVLHNNLSFAQSNPQTSSALQVVETEYNHPEKSFKMLAPQDWNVKPDFEGYALYMEPKVKLEPSPERPVVADPNIRVAVVKHNDDEPALYMDARGLDEYAKQIESKMGSANGDLQVFSKNLVEDLPGGKKGFLYYVQDSRRGDNIMMAIMVISTDKFLYRVMFTDYKVFFDKNLQKYFPILGSIQTNGVILPRPNLMFQYLPWGLGFVGAIVLLFIVFRVRGRRNNFESGDDSFSNAAAPLSEIPKSVGPVDSVAPQSAPLSTAPVSTAAPSSFFPAESNAPASAAAPKSKTGFPDLDD